MQSTFTFELDGELCQVSGESVHRTLAEYLCERSPWSSRYAEGTPWQGGCPVILAEVGESAPRFRAVDAHLLLLPMLADAAVWTPEGIARADASHPVASVLDIDHIDCGEEGRFSILALLFEGYYRPDLRRLGQMNEQLDAIISRTADVGAIREFGSRLFAAAEQMRHEASQHAIRSGRQNEVWTGKKDVYGDRFSKALFNKKNGEALDYVDREKVRFHRPSTFVELQRLLVQYPDAQLIAGGTGMLDRPATERDWQHLISVQQITDMRIVQQQPDCWSIGAAASLTRVAEAIGSEYPAFSKSLNRFASRPVRNRATLGGHLALEATTSQLVPVLMAMDARVILISSDGERDVPLATYYAEDGSPGLRAERGEWIGRIEVPRANDAALANQGLSARICDTYSVGPRRNLCHAYVTAAYALELREHTIAKAWVSYSGVAARPIRARQTEDALVGRVWGEETLNEVLVTLHQEIAIDIEPLGQASASYLKQLVMTLLQKFFHQHPGPRAVEPVELGHTRELARADQPFFDAV